MRTKRILVQGASWYEVRTAVNNREPLFQQQQAIRVFCRVLGEAQGRFTFELRGFRLEKEWLSFYIKPAEGLQLPAIMQWLKQTFAVRFNRYTKKTGHVWGDRYWSKVLSGEPPEEAGEVGWKAVEVAAETGEISVGPWLPDGVSPLTAENPAETGFSPQTPAHPPPPPG
jgi:REP element-mobilizing transposase RayT